MWSSSAIDGHLTDAAQWQTTIQERSPRRRASRRPRWVKSTAACTTTARRPCTSRWPSTEDSRRREEPSGSGSSRSGRRSCYLTAGCGGAARRGSDCLAYFYSTIEPGIPVVSDLALPIVSRLMAGSLAQGPGGAEEHCAKAAQCKRARVTSGENGGSDARLNPFSSSSRMRTIWSSWPAGRSRRWRGSGTRSAR